MSIIDVEDEECLDSYTMPIRKGNYTSIREASKSNGIYRKTKKNRQKFSSLFEDTDDSEEELAQELGESFICNESLELASTQIPENDYLLKQSVNNFVLDSKESNCRQGKNKQKFVALFEETDDDSEEELAQELGESFFKDEKVEVNNNLLCKNRRYLQHGEKEKSQDDESTSYIKEVEKQKGVEKSKMQLPPAYELAMKFRRCRKVIVYGGTLRIYESGAYVAIDENFYHILVEKMLSQGRISMKRRPTVREIRDSFAHLYAELRGEEFSVGVRVKKDENKIVFQNCIYDSIKQKQYPLSQKYMTFVPLRVNYLEGEIRTPAFDNFVRSLDGTGEEFAILKELLLNVLGYISITNPSGKCFFYLAPAMNSGKSLFASFIQEIFPEEMVSTESINDLNQRFAMADIEKKAICVSMDLTASTLTKDAVARIKNITGDRKVTVEQKYVPKKTVVHNCKFLFGSNHPIRIIGSDPAFWERVVIIPFVKSIPKAKQDINLLEKLLEEKDEIMTLAARSIKKLHANNFIFPETSVAKKMKNEWRGDVSNSVVQYVEQNCELQKDGYEFTSDLYEKYMEFCEEYFFDKIAITEFAKEISRKYNLKKGKRRKNGNPRNGFFGIKLKDWRCEI